MKKTIFSLLIVGAALASCSSNGEKAQTGEAQQIEKNENSAAVNFTKIEEGSNIAWRASHLAGVQPRWGKVAYKSANVQILDNGISAATIVIDMPSLTVENFGDDMESTAKLAGHLKSDDFFKTDTFPTATFELATIETNIGDYNSKVTGNLTILDVTKSISFQANISVTDEKASVISENFAIDRRDWGLTYNMEGTEGVPVDYLIANEIGFTINLQASK